MPDIQNRHQFEPDRGAKYWWLKTRKKSSKHGSVVNPGLFQTYGFVGDTIAIFLIIFGETYGTYAIIQEGGVSLASNIVLFAVLVDFICAMIIHRNKGRDIKLKCEMVFKTDAELAKLERDLSRGNFVTGIATIFILAIAFFKGFGFYTVYEVFDIRTVAMIIIYIGVAIMHIFYTGYFVWEVLTYFRFRSQYARFLDGDSNYKVGAPRIWKFNSLIKLEEKSSSQHQIMIDKNGIPSESAPYCYCLETKGILKDSDVGGLVGGQSNDEQRSIVSKECLKHQLEILEEQNARQA